MARFTEASKQAVLDSIDAAAVVGDYLRLEKKGGRYWGLCPFHHEKTPSFTVDADRKYYYCFGCHKGGSIVDFIMEMDKQSFPEAIETLAKRFGVSLSYEKGSSPGEDKSGYIEALADLYSRVAASFHYILLNKGEGEKAKQYIIDRGIAMNTIEQFRLGFSPADRSWLYRFLSGKGGFSKDFLAATGLFSPKYPSASFFSNRLMFPIGDKSGRTIAFGGRLLEGEGPKYINSPDSELFKKGRTLFAVDLALPEIRRTKEAYLAEGYMDVISLHQGGVTNAVAPLGTAFTDDQAKFLHRWADKVYLMLDNDEAGQNAAYKAVLCCRRNGLECAVVDTARFFNGKGETPKDPAEILQKFGSQALKKSVKCAILDIDFVITRSKTFKDTAQSVAFLFPYLDALDSEVARDVTIGAIAQSFGVEYRAVLDDYNRARQPERQLTAEKGVPSGISAVKKTFRAGDELYLLAAVFVNPGLFKVLRSALSPEDLEDSNARELYIVMEDWFRLNSDLLSGEENMTGIETGVQFCNRVPARSGNLLDMIPEGDLRDFILRQEASGAFTNPEKVLSDGIARMRSKILERRRREITRELRHTTHEDAKEADLLAEKMYIDAELKGRHQVKQTTRGAE
ncbi:MAG: DNA primase [Spirochaetaceae bacterium]|jgi:DNA primase|nr:DNA primase [Spirochaetaceae bacterium]